MLWGLEVAVIVTAAAVTGRLLLKRPIRREFAAHPVLGAGLIGAALAVGAALVWAGSRSPGSRHLIVAVVGSGLALAAWRALPNYGRSRGLPPGSLGLATSLDAVDDPDFYSRATARYGPIFKTGQIHQSVVCVTDVAMGLEVIERHRDALVQVEWPYNRLFPGGYFEFMNGDLHDRYRAMIAPALGPEVVADSRATIIAAVRSGLAEMARAADGGDVDPEPFLYPMTFPSLVRAVLGVSVDDPRVATLRELFTELNRPYELFLPTPKRMATAYRRTATIVGELATEAAASGPAPAGRRSVLSEVIVADPSRGSDPTLIGNLIMMVKDGSTIVRGQLRWVLKAVGDDPRWTDRLVDLAASGDGAGAVDAMATSLVHETLRRSGTRYVYRRVARDTRLGPYRVPRGWLLRLCFDQAHDNPDRYPEPKRFDPDRFLPGLPGPIDYCPFGHGTHACVGAELTLEIARALARESALGFRLRTVTDGPAWRINRHWGIWRPSASWRLAIAARTRSGDAGSSSIQTPQAS
ncbi:MAG: cytochrome P450 [Gemmatimonadales bacterium]